MSILITGCAGFVGFHTTKKLLELGYDVIGIDNLNSYYSKKLKLDRLSILKKTKNVSQFHFFKINIVNKKLLFNIFKKRKILYVIHLAAQAGVRYSLQNPESYITNNINGFFNIIEACKKFNIRHLYFASSSSVYGNQEKVPYNENDEVSKPISIYAASKISNELISYSYSNLYNMNITGFRFFTVYGPWGRPDMAPFIFLDSLMNGKEINLFNKGDLIRDFTFVDDIVGSIIKILKKDEITSTLKYRIFNIGNSTPIHLKDFVFEYEKTTNKNLKLIIYQCKKAMYIKRLLM